MNTVQSPTLPTISFFNKAILDSLGIWGRDVVDVELDVMATEDQHKAIDFSGEREQFRI